jgi:DNA-binding CsgD family transcriptional regulator
MLKHDAAYGTATSDERRRAHAALAEQTLDRPDLRAWHRANGALGADDTVADALDIVAESALARTGYAAAAAAFGRAADLSTSPRERSRRLLRAAEATWMSGRVDFSLADRLRESVEQGDPDVALAANLMRGRITYLRDPRLARALMLDEARRLRVTDPGHAAQLAATASTFSIRILDADAAAEDAALARQFGLDSPLLTATSGIARLLHGDVEGFDAAIAAALEILDGFRTFDRSTLHRATDLYQAATETLYAAGEGEAARAMIEPIEITARSFGITLATILAVDLARLDFARGRWDRTRARAAESARLAEEIGYIRYGWIARSYLAELAAARGEAAECETQEQAAAAMRGDFGTLGHLGRGAKGLLALGGHAFDDAASIYERTVIPEAGDLWLWPEIADAIEACLRAGRRDAERRLETFSTQAELSRFPWATARATRMRAIVSTGTEMEDAFDQAIHLAEVTSDPFQLARTQLAYGERLRRSKRRVDARVQLRRAAGTFERLRALPWNNRALRELAATGERSRPRKQWNTDELTPQELQVALLVANGATNAEAAAHLFLSPKTIEYHLRNVYLKLGLRSRVELATTIQRAGLAAD